MLSQQKSNVRVRHSGVSSVTPNLTSEAMRRLSIRDPLMGVHPVNDDLLHVCVHEPLDFGDVIVLDRLAEQS